MVTILARTLIAAALLCAPAHADQPSIAIPTTSAPFIQGGNLPTWDNAVSLYLNPALRGITSNFFGPSCESVQNPLAWQWCVDTSARAVRMYSQPIGGGAFAWQTLSVINTDGSLSPSNVLGNFTAAYPGLIRHHR